MPTSSSSTSPSLPPSWGPTPGPADSPVVMLALAPGNAPFAARRDQTVLGSALAAGHDLPSSCRNGTCRRCIGRLHSGSVRYRIDWPGLSAEEKADGLFLPCVAYPNSDLHFSEGA